MIFGLMQIEVGFISMQRLREYPPYIDAESMFDIRTKLRMTNN